MAYNLTNNYVKFVRGSKAAFDALVTKESTTLYFITDAVGGLTYLYLGDQLISCHSTSDATLKGLSDTNIGDSVTDGSFLTYNAETGKWVPYTLDTTAFASKAYEVELSSGETHSAALTRVVDGATLVEGDIAIVKEVISGDKKSHTAYVYNGSAWAAMDGNYSAENVYFDEDLTYTANIGVKTVPASGSGTISAAGKNVAEVFKSILAEEKNPSKTNPTCSVTLTGGNKSLEVGSKVSPAYTTSFNSGSYTYGPATGITATGYTASFNEEEKDTASGTFSEYTVVEGTKKISLTVEYSQGEIPKTNLGNDYAAGRIAAGSCTATSAHGITGYRNMFYGAMAGGEYTSATIRALTGKKATATGNINTFGVTGVAGADRVVVAVPEARSITKVIMPSALNADATSNFVLQEDRVSVEGAGGYAGVNYKVYVYKPDALASDMTFTVTIG